MQVAIKNFFLGMLSVLSLAGCNFELGYKSPQQVSKSIEESKQKSVFIKDYSISNIKVLSMASKFPIEQSWEEKSWFLELDSFGNEVPKVMDTSCHNIVFSLNKIDTFLTVDNFTEGKWIILMDNSDNPTSSIAGMINVSLLAKYNNEKLSFTIFKENQPYNIKSNVTPMFKFDLISNQ